MDAVLYESVCAASFGHLRNEKSRNLVLDRVLLGTYPLCATLFGALVSFENAE